MWHIKISPIKILLLTATGITFASQNSYAEIIKPVEYIKKNGYHTSSLGEDGKTKFYNRQERTTAEKIKSLESEVDKLPKSVEIFKVCDWMRGVTKSKLVEQNQMAIDVALKNYGYNGNTIVCVLKYIKGAEVGTQVFFAEENAKSVYSVGVSH